MITADTHAAESDTVKALEDLHHTVKRHPLPVGDFRIDGPQLAVVVERKKVADYRASIIDGRLKSQKKRALELAEGSDTATKCVIVVEGERVGWGPSAGSDSPISDKALSGSFVRSALRDGIPCFFSRNAEETAMVLQCIVDFVGSKSERPISLGKRPRAALLDSPTAALLSSIPGVGTTAAVAVSAAFPSASALVSATEDELAATKLTEKRKLGPKLAKTVKVFFS